MRPVVLEAIHRVLPIAGFQDLESDPFQQEAENKPVFRAVIDNQKAVRGLARDKADRLAIPLPGMN
jgi:hypothetical protein